MTAEAMNPTNEELLRAADAVVERWHSVDWKAPHTAEYIDTLRKAADRARAELSRREPVQVPEELVKQWDMKWWVTQFDGVSRPQYIANKAAQWVLGSGDMLAAREKRNV